MIIFDEAGFLKADVIQAIAPTFRMLAFSCIAASTLGESNGAIFNRMLKEPKFQTYIKTYICEACESLGLTDTACIHRIADRPRWLNDDEDVDELLQRMFGSNAEKYARETLGWVRQDFDTHVFRADKIDDLLLKPRSNIHRDVDLVFVTIDPCNGSEDPDALASHYCIFTYCEPGILVGCDAVDAPNSDVAHAALERHLHRLAEIPWFKKSTIVVNVEANNSFSADIDYKVVKRVYGNKPGGIIQVNTYSGNRKQGVVTTNPLKRDMAKLMQEMLMTNRLSIFQDFISGTPKIFEMIEKQFKAYEKFIKPGKLPTDPNSATYSGKHQGPDDICVTMQRGLYTAYNFFKSKEGIEYLSRI